MMQREAQKRQVLMQVGRGGRHRAAGFNAGRGGSRELVSWLLQIVSARSLDPGLIHRTVPIACGCGDGGACGHVEACMWLWPVWSVVVVGYGLGLYTRH